MSVIGFTSGWCISDSARSAMWLARSPMRSRSVLILSAAVRNRRSRATGWGGARLAERQQAGDDTVDLHLHAIDLRLVANHLLRQIPILLHQRAYAMVNGRFHHSGHFEQLLIQLFQFDTKMPQRTTS